MERLIVLFKKSCLNMYNKDGSVVFVFLYGLKIFVEKEVLVYFSVFSIKRFRVGVCVVCLGY